MRQQLVILISFTNILLWGVWMPTGDEIIAFGESFHRFESFMIKMTAEKENLD